MPQPLMPPPMMARSNTLSNETLPRQSPVHFGDFTFGWELITKKNESKTKAENPARLGTAVGFVGLNAPRERGFHPSRRRFAPPQDEVPYRFLFQSHSGPSW